MKHLAQPFVFFARSFFFWNFPRPREGPKVGGGRMEVVDTGLIEVGPNGRGMEEILHHLGCIKPCE